MSTSTTVAWRMIAISAAALSCLAGPVALAQAPVAGARDSITLTTLVALIDGSSAAGGDSVTTALRARSSVYLPMLERWTRSPDRRLAVLAGAAIGRSGPGAHDLLRRFVRDGNANRMDGPFVIAIGEIPTSVELLEVLQPLLEHPDPAQRRLGVGALVRWGTDAPVLAPAWYRAIEDTSADVRAVALWRIRPSPGSPDYDDRIAARLVELIDSPHAEERMHAFGALGSFHPQGQLAVPRAKQLAESNEDVMLRAVAVVLLVRQRVAPRELVPLLIRLLRDPEGGIRSTAMRSMGTVGIAGLDREQVRAVIDTLESYLGPREHAMPEDAANVLMALGAPARDALARALASRNIRVQLIAVRGLSHFGDDPAVDRPLLDALGNIQPIIRDLAGLALVGATGRVEKELTQLAAGGSEAQAKAAQHALTIIRAVRTVGVADRCYAVTYGPWDPAIPSDRVKLLTAPSRLRFRTILAPPSYDLLPRMFVAEQEIGGAWNTDGRWRPDTTQAALVLDGALYGSDVALTLRSASDGSLVGKANTYWDGYRGETQASQVRLTTTACGAR